MFLQDLNTRVRSCLKLTDNDSASGVTDQINEFKIIIRFGLAILTVSVSVMRETLSLLTQTQYIHTIRDGDMI